MTVINEFMFDENGDLKPVRLMCCSQLKFKSFFIDGLNHPNRNALWENYKKFITCLKNQIFSTHFIVWIFGSFVTDNNPNDIDLVIWVSEKDKLSLNDNDAMQFIFNIADEHFSIQVQQVLEMPLDGKLSSNVPDWLSPLLTGRRNNRATYKWIIINTNPTRGLMLNSRYF